MSNILFIVGLPASGKSTLAKKINKDNGGKYLIIDDPKNFELDIQPHLDRDLIITDPQLCFEKNRQSAEQRIKSINSEAKIDWIFFENDPESCLINAEVRNRANQISFKPVKNVKTFIENFSKYYTIPSGATVVEVYKR
jgi:hypothetical protein